MIELQRLTGPAIWTPADAFGFTYPLITRLRTTAIAVRFTSDHERRKYCGRDCEPRRQHFCFSHKDVMEAMRELRHKARTTPLSCGHRPGNNVKARPKKKPGEFYKTQAYGRAIITACDKAKVPRWHPHQLRHNAATWLRKEFGLDVARASFSIASAKPLKPKIC